MAWDAANGLFIDTADEGAHEHTKGIAQAKARTECRDGNGWTH